MPASTLRSRWFRGVRRRRSPAPAPRSARRCVRRFEPTARAASARRRGRRPRRSRTSRSKPPTSRCSSPTSTSRMRASGALRPTSPAASCRRSWTTPGSRCTCDSSTEATRSTSSKRSSKRSGSRSPTRRALSDVVQEQIEDYVRSLGLDAYLVGGAVRDELLGRDSKDADFVVPGVDYEGLHAALEPHGKVEELEVAGRRVGARLHPRDPKLRRLAPAGIEFAPPRAERSTGPGRHDFEIVADPALSIEDDMSRRDFTVNAMARRLETGELVDPFGGQDDLKNGVLRTVRPRTFAEDPLRLVRGLRLVAQLGLEPDATTLRQMKEDAESVRLVSGERVGGGLRADGIGGPSQPLPG